VRPFLARFFSVGPVSLWASYLGPEESWESMTPVSTSNTTGGERCRLGPLVSRNLVQVFSVPAGSGLLVTLAAARERPARAARRRRRHSGQAQFRGLLTRLRWSAGRVGCAATGGHPLLLAVGPMGGAAEDRQDRGGRRTSLEISQGSRLGLPPRIPASERGVGRRRELLGGPNESAKPKARCPTRPRRPRSRGVILPGPLAPRGSSFSFPVLGATCGRLALSGYSAVCYCFPVRWGS
jgi:hypothetical protein